MIQDVQSQAVPDLEVLRAELLRDSRFLGVHQAAWGITLGTLGFAGAFLVSSAPLWSWLAFSVGAWLLVEFAFLPRRREAKRLAEYQRRQEVARIAIARGVPLNQVG